MTTSQRRFLPDDPSSIEGASCADLSHNDSGLLPEGIGRTESANEPKEQEIQGNAGTIKSNGGCPGCRSDCCVCAAARPSHPDSRAFDRAACREGGVHRRTENMNRRSWSWIVVPRQPTSSSISVLPPT